MSAKNQKDKNSTKLYDATIKVINAASTCAPKSILTAVSSSVKQIHKPQVVLAIHQPIPNPGFNVAASVIIAAKDINVALGPVANGICTSVETILTKIKSANVVLLPIGIAIDVGRIVYAINEDRTTKGTRRPRKSLITFTTVLTSWGGNIGGGIAGAKTGIIVGTFIGGLFGGVGAIPGAAIGGFVGTVAGSITCGTVLSNESEKLARKLTNKCLKRDETKQETIEKTLILYISTCENSKKLQAYVLDIDLMEMFMIMEISDILSFLDEFPLSLKEQLQAVVFNVQNYPHPEHLADNEVYQKYQKTFAVRDIPCHVIDEKLMCATSLLFATSTIINPEETVLTININDNILEVFEICYHENQYNEIVKIRSIVIDIDFDLDAIKKCIIGESEPKMIIAAPLISSPRSQFWMNFITKEIHLKNLHVLNDPYHYLVPEVLVTKALSSQFKKFDVKYNSCLLPTYLRVV